MIERIVWVVCSVYTLTCLVALIPTTLAAIWLDSDHLGGTAAGYEASEYPDRHSVSEGRAKQ